MCHVSILYLQGVWCLWLLVSSISIMYNWLKACRTPGRASKVHILWQTAPSGIQSKDPHQKAFQRRLQMKQRSVRYCISWWHAGNVVRVEYHLLLDIVSLEGLGNHHPYVPFVTNTVTFCQSHNETSKHYNIYIYQKDHLTYTYC